MIKVANKKINQAADHFAYTMDGGDFEATDVTISAGGFLRCLGGNSVNLVRVIADAPPAGSGKQFIITATNPLKDFLWDNRDAKGNAIDRWIVNGDEQALRLMQCHQARVYGVKFRCCKKKDAKSGKIAYYKSVTASRSDGPDGKNGDGQHTYSGCWFIGPHEVGRQKDASGSRQQIGKVIYDGCYMSTLPRISAVNGKSGVKQLVIRGCKKIDDNGKVIGTWPDQTVLDGQQLRAN